MTGDLVYQQADGRRVAFAPAALNALSRYRQVRESDPEAGGVLLGRIIADSGDVVIDEVTEPMAQNARARFAFLRRKQPTQRLVDSAWADSSGTCIYLGEWHSHPEDRPTPSPQDLRNWRAIVEGATYEQDDLLFVIIGIEHVGVWMLRRGEETPAQLNVDLET